MKEKYRAMLAEMLEDIQRQDRMECALRSIAEAMRASAAGFVIIAEAASHFADDLARDDAISELERQYENGEISWEELQERSEAYKKSYGIELYR